MRSNAGKIDALLRKWLALLPHPFTPQDRAAGFRYDLSIVQAEFARTQVLDRPVAGRIFIEEVIRENLELGRPDNVQLIFERRVTKRTPGRFRTRVVTEGVLPSLYIDYKSSRIKQYFKEGQALRTETTINDSYDFGIGRRLENLSALRELGFTANRRLLDVQRASQDCRVGEDVFREVTSPRQVNTQRASASAKARRQRAPTAPPPPAPAAPAPRATTVNPSPCSAMERRQPAGLMALIPHYGATAARANPYAAPAYGAQSYSARVYSPQSPTPPGYGAQAYPPPGYNTQPYAPPAYGAQAYAAPNYAVQPSAPSGFSESTPVLDRAAYLRARLRGL